MSFVVCFLVSVGDFGVDGCSASVLIKSWLELGLLDEVRSPGLVLIEEVMAVSQTRFGVAGGVATSPGCGAATSDLVGVVTVLIGGGGSGTGELFALVLWFSIDEMNLLRVSVAATDAGLMLLFAFGALLVAIVVDGDDDEDDWDCVDGWLVVFLAPDGCPVRFEDLLEATSKKKAIN